MPGQPTTGWLLRGEEDNRPLFEGAMKTDDVCRPNPGPSASSQSRIGVEVTDSAYVVANMHIMSAWACGYRPTWQFFGFCSGIAFPGRPQTEPPLRRAFPEEKTDLEHCSGYGGNALWGKKFCFANRRCNGSRTRLDGRTHANPGA